MNDNEENSKNDIKKREGFFELSRRLKNSKKELEFNEEDKLTAKDWFALLFSAFYTIFLPVCLFMGVFVLLIFLIFGII